ncbi:MAG: hypothetical protein WC933_02080 [Candidatus Paceibacterota bacterium]|jgi:hypothetical protein
MEKKIWFRAKTYGWGWYPITWQGWAVIFTWVIIFATIISNVRINSLEYWVSIIVSISILIYICYKKGEKPGWRWGKK